MAPGATILGCLGPVLSADEAAFFRAADPWGFILFARNVETPDQLGRLTADLRASVGRDAPILVDQEGGRVQRLRAPHWREWLPPRDQMAHGGARAMHPRSRLMAAELRAVGIDANCAPTLDIATAATHPFLRNRCYGTTLADVVAAGRAVADGLLAGGVLPVMKHMPGHGRASGDTHLDLPTVSTDLETLMASDFAAFAALKDLPMAMTAHIVFSAIDPAAPATLSPVMIRLIRERIGFGGLLMTDDLSMQALAGTLAERAARSVAAGCDIVLHCNGEPAEMAEVVEASGRLTPDGQARATAALAARHAPDAVDLAALAAEFDAVTRGQGDG